MVGWTLLAVILYTIVACLFKVVATRTQPRYVITVAMFVVTLCSVVGMLISGEALGSWHGALIAAAAGVFFYWSSMYQLKALQTAPASLVSAITSLNLVVAGAVILFIPLFNNSPFAFNHVLALLVAAGAIMVGIHPEDMDCVSSKVLISLGFLVLCSVAYSYYAKTSQPIFFYMMINHLVALLINGRSLSEVRIPDLKWGLVLGLCMFVAFWSLLSALAVSGAHTAWVLLALNLKTPLTALLAVPLFNEHLSVKKTLAVGLATCALMLWRI